MKHSIVLNTEATLHARQTRNRKEAYGGMTLIKKSIHKTASQGDLRYKFQQLE